MYKHGCCELHDLRGVHANAQLAAAQAGGGAGAALQLGGMGAGIAREGSTAWLLHQDGAAKAAAGAWRAHKAACARQLALPNGASNGGPSPHKACTKPGAGRGPPPATERGTGGGRGGGLCGGRGAPGRHVHNARAALPQFAGKSSSVAAPGAGLRLAYSNFQSLGRMMCLRYM